MVELLLNSAVDLRYLLILLETLVHQVVWRICVVLKTLVVLGHVQSLALTQVDVRIGWRLGLTS